MKSHENRRILVIDDNHAIHEDFRKILCPARIGGDALAQADAAMFDDTPDDSAVAFEVHSAMQGQEGLAKVQQSLSDGQPYAMAFIDVRMPPGWDGVETTAKIWEAYPDLQIVICTAYSDYSWDDMIARVGQSDRLLILKKPFDNVEVLQLAHALTTKWGLLQEVKAHTRSLEQAIARGTPGDSSTNDLIATVDTEGRFTGGTPSWEDAFGIAARVHPEDRPALLQLIQTAIQFGASQELRFRLEDATGAWRAFECMAHPFRQAGETERAIIIGR